MKYYPIIVSGPSGTGKDTAIKALMRKNSQIRDAVGYTTRKPRYGEIDGKDISFVTKEQFQVLIRENLLLEYAQFDNEYYGMPKKEVERAEKELTIFNVGISGAKAIKSYNKDAIAILLLPPSKEELIKRMGTRGEERLKRVRNDVTEAVAFFDFCIVSQNNEFDKLVSNIESIIYYKNPEFHISNSLEFISSFLASF